MFLPAHRCATGLLMFVLSACATLPGDDDAGVSGPESDGLVGNTHEPEAGIGPGGEGGRAFGGAGGGGSGGGDPGPGGLAAPADAGPQPLDARVGPLPPDAAPGEFAPASLEVCAVVNAYRRQVGLPNVPLSTVLMRVAQAHVSDLNRHPEITNAPCNLHSWSADGPWSACCYTDDHARAQCMWDKAREIGGGAYMGDGFEIAAAGGISPQQALELWQTSPPHHEVILNVGIWADLSPWPAMGCGLQGSFAVVWFGSTADPDTL